MEGSNSGASTQALLWMPQNNPYAFILLYSVLVASVGHVPSCDLRDQRKVSTALIHAGEQLVHQSRSSQQQGHRCPGK